MIFILYLTFAFSKAALNLTVAAKMCWKLPVVGPYGGYHMSPSNCKSCSCQRDEMILLWGRNLKIKGSGTVFAITETSERVRRLG